MAIQRIFSFGLEESKATRKDTGPLLLPPTVKKDVFLNALLEMPAEKRPRRSPLEWAGAGVLHVLILAALIVVPLYTTGTIRLGEYEDIPLVAPPPPAPMATGGPVLSHVTHPKARLTYDLHKLRAPNAIPKKISHEDAGGAPIARAYPCCRWLDLARAHH